MSKTIIKCIALLTLAGILLTPACSNKDEIISKDEINVSSSASPSNTGESPTSTEEPKNTTEGAITSQEPQASTGTEQEIQVITSEEELEQYFDSISDEEIEELFKIIEDIDISDAIDPEADPGFDEVIIPDAQ